MLLQIHIHTFENENAFFHHELFHYYHRFPNTGELWNSLWAEGLAVYVAHQLNPQASADELLLNYPPDLIPQVQSQFVSLCNDLRAHLYSVEPQDYQRFFLATAGQGKYPARSGYVLGYLVVKQLARKYPLEQLIGLQPQDVAPLLDAQLAEMALQPDFPVLRDSLKNEHAFKGAELSG